MEPTTTRV